MTSRHTVRAVALVAVVATAVLYSMRPAAAEADADPGSNRPTVDAVQLYETRCSSCHGMNGEGVADRGPSIVNEGEAAVDFVLRTGRMPLASPENEATRGPVRFTDNEIVAIVSLIGSWGSGPTIPIIDTASADLVDGGDLYRLNCAACHVASGAGAVIGGARRAPSLMQATPEQVAEAILVGPGAMPVFGELSNEDLNDLAAYVEELQRQGTTDIDAVGGVGPVAEGLAGWLLALVPLVGITFWISHRPSPKPVDEGGPS
ncbi:MAG: c-type cytochrome [Acidimicrobiales bacterium]|nr:c-type cytochrome [Acidimicrobiales bacterium]